MKGGLEEEFGAHVVETVLLESVFDAGQIAGEVLEFFFIRGSIFFLEFFDLHAFEEMDLSAMFAFPMEKGRFGEVEFVGDFAQAPAIGTEDEEGVLLFSGVHNSSF